IAASGMVVAPGFLDVHTHYDAQLAWDPYCTPSCFHGVTSVLMGNCGLALAPATPEAGRDFLVQLFSSIEQIPRPILSAGVPFAWQSYPQFLEWLRGHGLGVNVMAQVGHSALRYFVMGDAALERQATEEEIDRMARLAAEALDAGAIGISTSQVAHQVDAAGRHIPTYFASDDEVFALARTVKAHGRGFMCLNPRTKLMGPYREDGDFMARLAEASGAPVTWNDFGQRAAEPDIWQQVLGWMEAAIDAGRPVYAVARSQPNEPAFDLAGASPVLADLPGWPDFGRLDHEAKLASLRDPAQRRTLAAALALHPRFDQVYVKAGASAASRDLSGRSITAVARERGVDAGELLLDLAAQEDLETWFGIATDSAAQDAVMAPILRSRATLVGISDAGAHVQRARADFPSYFLRHWMGDTGTFTLEEAVHQLTGQPAQVFGLRDRGRLEPGCAADVVIFDEGAIAPLPLEMRHDLPGGGRRLFNRASGIPWVLVSGEPIVEEGELTAARPGHILS
ncbi:MAG: N-acyl-D-amino-acid deacylase family protein, partial [Chloroflexota bacterium]